MNKRSIAAVMLGLLCVNIVMPQSSPPAAAPGAAPPRVTRPTLLFREEWKQTAKGGEHPVSAESVGNGDLELNLHVPAGEILLTGAGGPGRRRHA